MKQLIIISLLFTINTGITLAAQLSVDLIPGSNVDTTLSTSGNFNIDIILNNATDLAGFEFDLEFDNTVLTATSITSGNVFGMDTFLIDDAISTGNVSFSETSLAIAGLNINKPTVIASLSFDAIFSGKSILSLTNVILSDSAGLEISAVNLTSGEVTVVPVPAAFWLFITGLMGMLGISTKSNRFYSPQET